MTLPSVLLFVMGLLGAADIVFFHTRLHRIREHAECRWELVTHALRGPTYAALFVLLPNVVFAGAWLTAPWGLLLFDVGISVADFCLEPASRAPQGGLPRGEYLLHVLLAMLFGALVATVLAESAPRWGQPASLGWISDGPPTALRLVLAAMAPVVLVSGWQDFRAVRRLRRAVP